MYKEIVAQYLDHTFRELGIKVDNPMLKMILSEIFRGASEQQCEHVYEITRNFIFETEGKITAMQRTTISSEVKSLELKL